LDCRLFGQPENPEFESPFLPAYSWQASGKLFRQTCGEFEGPEGLKPLLHPVSSMDYKSRRLIMNYARNLAIMLAGVLLLGGCDLSVNSSIDVPDGETRSGLMATVNGDVTIGRECTIEGSSTTVNGSVKVGDRSNVGDLSAVNGSVRTGKGVSIDGDAKSVNGSVELGVGTKVSGEVSTVNGTIELDRTIVQGDVRTKNGNIKVQNNSVVKGDVVIESMADGSNRSKPIEIEVTGGSIIEGDVKVMRMVDVRLILSGGAKVLGQVDGVEVIEN